MDREAANLATARAVKLQAEASLNRVQKDLDRYDKLIRTGAISVKNLTDAQQNLKEMQAALEQAEAGIKQAEASLENARINLDRTKVRAPGGFFRDGKTGSQPSDGWNRECENRAHGRHAGF